MDNTTKNMCKQLREGYYRKPLTEGITSNESNNDEKRTFNNESSVVSDFVNDIQGLIETVPITFNELYFYPSVNKVQWSGTIGSGLEWASELGGDGKAFHITADNVKYTLEETRALLKLHAYFDSSWVTAIRDAIKNKDLSEKKN